MKQRLHFLALLLSPLFFADDAAKAGGTAVTQSPVGTGTLDTSKTLPYGERAASIFKSIEGWTPGQFRNAVEIGEAHSLRDPFGNTVMHQALADDNLPIVELLVQDYGFRDLALVPNKVGQTCLDIAKRKGDEFMGVFGDIEDPNTIK